MPALAPYVWCGPFSEGPADLPQESVHIYLWPMLDSDFAGEPTGWIIRGVLDDIEPGQPIQLPSTMIDLGDPPVPPMGVHVFAVADLNDYASSADTSSGSVVFETEPCLGDATAVSLTIDAVLGAEDAGPETIKIEGSISSGLNEPPQRDLFGL